MADLEASGFCFYTFAFVKGVKGLSSFSLVEDDAAPAIRTVPSWHLAHPGISFLMVFSIVIFTLKRKQRTAPQA